MKYSIKDLKRVREAYDKNFARLLKARYTSLNRLRLLKIERRLNKLDIKIRRELGVERIWQAIIRKEL